MNGLREKPPPRWANWQLVHTHTHGAKVSAARTAICVVRNSQELCLYSDSKLCVDILTICGYISTEGGWQRAKNPVYHHDVWEEVYQLLECRTAPVSVTHVYGHNRIMYNNAVDALAKA